MGVQSDISMLRLVCLVALAALCSAGGLGGYKEAVMKEYAHYKIQEGCFGKEMVMEYKMQMMKASKKCSVEVPGNGTDSMLDFQEIINEIRAAALRYNPDSGAGQYYRLVPVLQNGRYRRQVNDAFLRNQLQYGFDMCKDFAKCMPVKKAKTTIMKELGTCISFFKCMEMKKMEACLMKDFREAMADYGFDAVEEKINMGLEMMGEEVHHEGMDGYNTLEMAMMGNMF